MFGGPDLLPAGAYVTEPPPETELTVLFRERKLALVFDMIAGPDQHPNRYELNMKDEAGSLKNVSGSMNLTEPTGRNDDDKREELQE